MNDSTDVDFDEAWAALRREVEWEVLPVLAVLVDAIASAIDTVRALRGKG